jgi:hypothetical protein
MPCLQMGRIIRQWRLLVAATTLLGSENRYSQRILISSNYPSFAVVRTDSTTPAPPSCLQPNSYIPFLSLIFLCDRWFSDPDPNPDGSALTLVGWIRFRIQEGKKTHKNVRKLRSFMFRNAGCSLLRGESFCCTLDVFYGGLGIIQLQFFQFLVIKTLDLDPDPL